MGCGCDSGEEGAGADTGGVGVDFTFGGAGRAGLGTEVKLGADWEEPAAFGWRTKAAKKQGLAGAAAT